MKFRTSKEESFPWLMLLLGLVIGGVALAFGMSWYQTRYPSWYEEIRLSDGRVITVHQKREFFENYGTTQSWVRINLPELGGEQVWHSYLMPQRVDVVDGKVYVFGLPRGDRQYKYYRYPKNYMVAFKWSGSEFERIPFLEVPVSLRIEENIFPCIPTSLSLLSLIQKNSKWCEPIGDYKQLGKKISLEEYQSLAIRYSRRSGGAPISD